VKSAAALVFLKQNPGGLSIELERTMWHNAVSRLRFQALRNLEANGVCYGYPSAVVAAI
jgi:hypothetical protein